MKLVSFSQVYVELLETILRMSKFCQRSFLVGLMEIYFEKLTWIIWILAVNVHLHKFHTSYIK